MPIVLLVVTIVLSIVVDVYIYRAARKRVSSAVPARIQLISSLALYSLLIVGFCLPMRSGDEALFLAKMWVLFSYVTFIVAKLVFVVFDLIASIPRLFGHRRIRLLSLAGGVLAVITFIAMWWGALVNRLNINTENVTVNVAELPQPFDGYRIVQISDLHVGTFGADTAYVSKVVDYVNSLNPDVVLFTGDIVNRTSDELKPFVGTLSRLECPDGVYSILGNHDYGDYYNWDCESDKKASLDSLVAMQKRMGWRLLLNEYEIIRRDGDSIAVVGVENVGDPPFKVYGDLKASYPDLSDSVTKILLTHNPAHWQMEIADRDDMNVGLTLSGHTHAMQMSAFGWSPAAWRYDNWGGLYFDKSGRHPLYVNIGIGTVGMPMRIGATPEVTVITLKKK